MIPKVIHYCWFGGKKLPDDVLKCIESWKKYAPEYEIIEWNENNYDVNVCTYVKEAFMKKKWAFVSDFARYDILYKYGGIYFDTDVQMIKSIDDIVDKGPFMGFECKKDEKTEWLVSPGIGIAAYPGMDLYRRIIDFYKNQKFILEDNTLNPLTVCDYTTNILKADGLKPQNTIQKIDGIYIYPTEYFCPKNYFTGELDITDNTRTIHHYTSSWLSEQELKAHNFEIAMQKKVGKKCARILERIYSLPYRVTNKVKTVGVKKSLNIVLKKIKRIILGGKSEDKKCL